MDITFNIDAMLMGEIAAYTAITIMTGVLFLLIRWDIKRLEDHEDD